MIIVKKPKIRFKGFTETWEQRKFKNIVERLSESYMSDDKNPSVEYEDIISELGTINKDIFNKRIRKNGIKFSNNEILYGKLRPYLHNWLKPDFNGIAVGDWWVLKPINCDREFIFRLIQTSTFDNIANQSNGTKMPRADWNLIANSDFYLPISIYEQKQIGSLFSKLDHLITLHQRKCENLKKLKKFMLQKLFPQNGENVPKVRFLNFTDTWEQRKLGNIMEVASVKRIHRKDWTDSGVRFLRARDIVSHFKNEKQNDCLYISKEKYDECSALSGKVSVGDLLVTGVGTIGIPYLVNDLNPIYFKDGNIIWFKNGSKINGFFLYYSFIGNEIQNFINVLSGTGTVGTYTIESGKKTSISLPDKLEQQKIGNFLKHLDHLITLHQSKCDKLKEVKKYMLQNMFI